MTVAAAGMAASPAPIPAAVREKGEDAVKTYRSAQDFERLLVQRLAATMTSGTSLAEGPYSQTIGEAFADGIVSGGGLGLADALYRSMTIGDEPAADAAGPAAGTTAQAGGDAAADATTGGTVAP